MKATGFVIALVVLAGGCREARLGQEPVIKAAFAAQAASKTAPPAELDAEDAQLGMARHREPLVPAQNATGARTMQLPMPGVLP